TRSCGSRPTREQQVRLALSGRARPGRRSRPPGCGGSAAWTWAVEAEIAHVRASVGDRDRRRRVLGGGQVAAERDVEPVARGPGRKVVERGRHSERGGAGD